MRDIESINVFLKSLNKLATRDDMIYMRGWFDLPDHIKDAIIGLRKIMKSELKLIDEWIRQYKEEQKPPRVQKLKPELKPKKEKKEKKNSVSPRSTGQKECHNCHKMFKATGNKQYYCPKCRVEMGTMSKTRRMQTDKDFLAIDMTENLELNYIRSIKTKITQEQIERSRRIPEAYKT